MTPSSKRSLRPMQPYRTRSSDRLITNCYERQKKTFLTLVLRRLRKPSRLQVQGNRSSIYGRRQKKPRPPRVPALLGLPIRPHLLPGQVLRPVLQARAPPIMVPVDGVLRFRRRSSLHRQLRLPLHRAPLLRRHQLLRKKTHRSSLGISLSGSS